MGGDDLAVHNGDALHLGEGGRVLAQHLQTRERKSMIIKTTFWTHVQRPTSQRALTFTFTW